MNRYFPVNKERFYYRKRNNRLRGRYCVFDFYKEAAATYTKAYNALYRQAVETQFDIQYALLNSGIAAGLALNTSLWGACGTANAAMFASVVENDTLPAVLTYLRSQSQSEVAAMVASAELYGEFQVNWRTDSYTISSVEDALQYAEQQADIAWAQKVAAARNAYYSQLGSLTTSFNSTVFDALESYNSTLLSAEIARAGALFDAAQSYSIDTYNIEADYAKSQFDTYKEKALKKLDAEIEESDALADLEAYYARKTADEYDNICKEAEEAEEENEELVDEEGNPVFYVVPDGSERRRQIDSDNYSQLYNFRKEITDKKTADSKKADEDARNAENADRVKYITDKIAVQTTYELAIANAEETYYNTITTAENTACAAVDAAEQAYNDAAETLDGQFREALAIIDEGGNIEEGHFNADTPTSLNNVQKNNNSNNNQQTSGTNSTNSSGQQTSSSANGSSNSGIWGSIKNLFGGVYSGVVETFSNILNCAKAIDDFDKGRVNEFNGIADGTIYVSKALNTPIPKEVTETIKTAAELNITFAATAPSLAAVTGVPSLATKSAAPAKTVSQIGSVALDYKKTPIYRGGNTFNARIGIDIIPKNGILLPGKGVSLNLSADQVKQFGGAYQIKFVPAELEIIQQGQNQLHYVISPKHPMSPDRYQELLNLIETY